MSKNVQISQELYLDLVRYFLLDDKSEMRLKAIETAIEEKLDRMVKHDLYTKYKTAEDAETAEKARQEYLDKVGMSDGFRY